LKSAIALSGTNVTINGNLTVAGTTTQIDSTTINIGDNIIELNYGGSQTTSGIIVKDATGGSTISGSLLWDSTNDYWKGGTLSNESKLLRADGDSVVSGSSQITPLLPTGVVSGSSQIPILLPTGIVSGSSQIPSLLPTGTISGSTQIANLGYATTGSNSFYGNQIISGNIYVTGSIIPSGSASFDLGTAEHPFRHLYVGSGSVYLGGNKALSISDSGQLTIDAQPQADAVNIKGGNLNVYGDIIVHGDNTLLAIRNDSGSNIGAIQSVGAMANDITFEGQYSGTSGFVFRNTHPSCSRSSGNYASIKPDEILFSSLSGSIIINNTSTDIVHNNQLNLTGGTIAISGSSTTIQGVNFNTFSSSLDSKFTTLAGVTSSLNTFSASMNAFYNQFTASGVGFSASVDSRLDELEYTASFGSEATIAGQFGALQTITASLMLATGSLQSFTSSQEEKNITIGSYTSSMNIFTASVNSHISNLNAATSSYETNGRGIVSGSSQITPLLPTGVISGSSQITSILPSGIVSGSAQVSGSIFTTISGDIAITTNGVATIQANSVALGVDTTGNYMSDLTQGTGVTISHTPGEGSTATISIAQAVATTSDVQFGSLGIGGAASGVSGEIRAIGDITAFYSSDIRLKENIVPIENALSKVEAITGNTYNWKDGFEEIHSHKGNDLGIIAQEVQSVLPEVVTERDNGYLAVDYIKLIPVLIEAIKELSAKIKDLEKK
jgi:hypothetical protein